MHASHFFLTFFLLSCVSIGPLSAAPVETPTPDGTKTSVQEQQQKEQEQQQQEQQRQQEQELQNGIAENAIRAPFQRFLLIRQGKRCVALQITEHPEHKPDRACYEWYEQSDGSLDFTRANVTKGTGEVYEKTAMPDGSQKLIIKAGSFRFCWSAGDWIYYPEWNLDTLVSMARTNWAHLSDVKANSKSLQWISRGKLVAWGPASAGLQLGAIEGLGSEPFPGGDVSWVLLVRNVSQKPINLVYYVPAQFEAHAVITDAQGRKIQVMKRYIAFPVSRTTHLLKPGDTFQICEYNLHLGPDKGSWAEGIDVPPGKYSVTLTYTFNDYKTESWKGTLQSGTVPLHVQAKDKTLIMMRMTALRVIIPPRMQAFPPMAFIRLYSKLDPIWKPFG